MTARLILAFSILAVVAGIIIPHAALGGKRIDRPTSATMEVRWAQDDNPARRHAEFWIRDIDHPDGAWGYCAVIGYSTNGLNLIGPRYSPSPFTYNQWHYMPDNWLVMWAEVPPGEDRVSGDHMIAEIWFEDDGTAEGGAYVWMALDWELIPEVLVGNPPQLGPDHMVYVNSGDLWGN